MKDKIISVLNKHLACVDDAYIERAAVDLVGLLDPVLPAVEVAATYHDIEYHARCIAETTDPSAQLKHISAILAQDIRLLVSGIKWHNDRGYNGKVGAGMRVVARMLSHLPTPTVHQDTPPSHLYLHADLQDAQRVSSPI
jgi:hypothetical protein